MRNYPEWIFAFMATTSLGAIAVPMNGWWTTEELDFGLEDCGAKLVVADRERVERIHPLMDNLGLKLISVRCDAYDDIRIERFEDLMEKTPACELPAAKIDPDDDAIILYTSGSTGYPKGVVSTHRAVLSALTTWRLFGTSLLMAAFEAIDEKTAAELESQPTYQPATLMTIPLFHSTGCHSLFLLSILLGRKIVLMYKWDSEKALELIERERITSFLGVPTMSWELLQSPNLDRYDLSSLQDISGGGAAQPPDHVAALKEKFPNKSPGLGYGLTETNALGAVHNGESYLLKPGSTGRPLPPVLEMKIVDDDGKQVPTGERGEVWIKGPCNFRAYWNKPEATREAITDDGWFRTSDIGTFDEDGFLYIVDRAKDIVIRGGENIACLEVEAAIYKHPDVLEASVFGVPDERLGEEMAAVVALKSGRKPTAESIQQFLSDHLAKFKVPTYLWLQQEKLPRIATGKIDKRQLRKTATEKLEEDEALIP
jgi:acyl-CoA synthetase (AMP-forming)/AMP-acid ligase II